MKKKSKNRPIRNISDTARWVAYYRSMETEREDALFKDPYAKLLAGDKGKEIVDKLPFGRKNAWGMIVRTVIMDEYIMQCVSEYGVDSVINLAAGLDTRPYRMNLSSSLHWYEVDLPDIIQYKEKILANDQPICKFEQLALDLRNYHARDAFFKRISENSQNVLILTEGLLAYLRKEEVEKLASDLHKYSNFTYWVSDISRPKALIKMKKYYGKYLEAANAMMHFAPENGTEFYKPLGWKCEDYRSAYEESRKINRKMMFDWIFRFYAMVIPPLYRKIMRDYDAGMVLLNRSDSL